MLYHWLGWISLAACILLLAKYIALISKNKRANALLRKIHKPLGLAVIGTGAVHALISILKRPTELAAILSGAALLALIVLLARTYFARTKLKAKWFRMHRHLALLLIALLIVHVLLSIS